jgi:hypothetical protein
MRKVAGLLCILALTFGTVASFAANKNYVVIQSTTKGSPLPKDYVKKLGPDHFKLNAYKAQNHLSAQMNQKIAAQQKGAQYHNCSGFLSIPCFDSWFITGTRNSIYTYSMVGQSPVAGGTTTLTNRVIPLTMLLIDAFAKLYYTFDPTAAGNNLPLSPLSDVQLAEEGPIWASNAYPGGGGLPADTGQFVDTTFRASFNGVKKANWHTPLGAPQGPIGGPYAALLVYGSDWLCYGGEAPPCTSFPVVNINTISNIFGQVLGPTYENVPSTLVPIILTDFVTAFIPGGGCCVLGFHSANQGNEGPGSVSVWTWATFISASNNPFGPFGNDTFVLTHELSELYHDPLVQTTGTLVSPWVDGSVSFFQTNLETGDAIEAMASADALWPVTQSTTGGAYTYSTQNEALLPWFTRNPIGPACLGVGGGYAYNCGPGIYSWPNTATLNAGHDPATPWGYGEGAAGFFYGPPY